MLDARLMSDDPLCIRIVAFQWFTNDFSNSFDAYVGQIAVD